MTDRQQWDEARKAAIAKGNLNIVDDEAEFMDLAETSKISIERQDELIRQVQAQRRARTIIVPTNDLQVKRRLREMQQPICMFGERAPERRERLRELLAAAAVAGDLPEEKKGGSSRMAMSSSSRMDTNEEYSTAGSRALKQARLDIARFSIPRAQQRLAKAKQQQEREENEEMEVREKRFTDMATGLRKYYNASSEIGDTRPLTCCAFSANSRMFATGSYGEKPKVWSVPDCKHLFTLSGHRNRVSDIAFHPRSGLDQDPRAANIATCGIDTAFLWPLAAPESSSAGTEKDGGPTQMDTEGTEESPTGANVNTNGGVGAGSGRGAAAAPVLKPLAQLRGHSERLCRIAFHPMGRHVATTSFDSTWKLYDINTQRTLITQTGHSRGTYALAFHPDGSLVGTGDVGGNALIWDIRTGKVVCPLLGHTEDVICADFSPLGNLVATGSHDHTVRVWDLRKRKSVYVVPAHSSVISNVAYQPEKGEYLVTSSFDNTCKIWGTREYTLIKTLAGHEQRVTRAVVSPDDQYIGSVSADRTWKLWEQDR